jgi:predicted transcriptional regulator
MWKRGGYKLLYKFVDQRHTNDETIQRIEKLLQRYEIILAHQERKKMKMLTTYVNEDCARLIMGYL